MYTAQARHADAEPIQRRSLEAWRRVRGPDHPNTIFAENNLGTTLKALKRDAEAEPLYADVYARAQRAQIPAALAATLMGNYGPTLVRLGKYAEAEAPLLEAHRRLRATNQASHHRTRDVIASLVALYERTGRADKASKWRAELDALPARPTTVPSTKPATTPT
jgi:tetratricopeptide (TPR) repeat protein